MAEYFNCRGCSEEINKTTDDIFPQKDGNYCRDCSKRCSGFFEEKHESFIWIDKKKQEIDEVLRIKKFRIPKYKRLGKPIPQEWLDKINFKADTKEEPKVEVEEEVKKKPGRPKQDKSKINDAKSAMAEREPQIDPPQMNVKRNNPMNANYPRGRAAPKVEHDTSLEMEEDLEAAR